MNYPSNRAPMKDAAFVELPLGAVKPAGWLKDQLRLQADGATGHLDEFWPSLTDTAWKGAKEGEPAWDSPWGPGRPGWHIECSAMSLKYLGAEFDIHGGGRDLIFPHHENEIAQAEGALDQPFVRFWMHNGMLNLTAVKMSKSLGNTLSLRDVLDKHRPEALVMAFLGSHYRSPLEFSAELLEETEQQVDRLRNVFRGLADAVGESGSSGAGGSGTEEASVATRAAARRRAFDEAMADDLNTAAALGEVFGLVREANAAMAEGDLAPAEAEAVREEMLQMVHILGLDSTASSEDSVPEDLEELAEERQRCRAAGDYARADEIRAILTERGYEVRDVPGGHKVVKTR